MTLHGTYQELIVLEADIEKQQKNSPAFAFFNRDKIKNFYSKNKLRISTAKAKLNEMMDEHIVVKDGVFQKTLNEKREEVWLFKTEADKAEYQAKLEALMTRAIEIHC